MRHTSVLALTACGLAALTIANARAETLTISGDVCEESGVPGFTTRGPAPPSPCRKPLRGAVIKLRPESGESGEITLATAGLDGRFSVGPIKPDDTQRYCVSAQHSGFLGVEICLPQPMLAQLGTRSLAFVLSHGEAHATHNAVAVYRERAGQTTLPDSSTSLELTTPWQIGGRGLTTVLQAAYDRVELEDLAAHRINAQTLRGKVALVVFWNLACRPCREELPTLRQLYARHHARGLEIIGISDDAPYADEFRDFVVKHDITWPQVLVDRLGDSRIAAFHVPGVPSMFLVDRSGKVQPPIGQADFEARVDSMFNAKR